LDEAATKADGHRGIGQPLRLELLQVVQQGLQLLSVPGCQLVGPLRVRDRCPPRSILERRCRVVEVEPPLFLVGGVVGEHQVDVRRLHVPT
jgi:hypothetical protein